MVNILEALKIDALRADELLECVVRDINSRNISSMPDILSSVLDKDDISVSEKMLISYAIGASVAKIELERELEKTNNKKKKWVDKIMKLR